MRHEIFDSVLGSNARRRNGPRCSGRVDFGRLYRLLGAGRAGLRLLLGCGRISLRPYVRAAPQAAHG